MYFGFKSAPITFQKMINILFSDMPGNCVEAHLDDLLVYSKDVETHLAIFEEVLLKLRDAGLKTKLVKC